MKYKLKSSYPCLVKTNNEAFDIDENDILEIEGEERLFIYPLSYSRRNIPFYINLNDLKDCDKFSVFDIDDDILIFLNKTERVRSFAKESLSFCVGSSISISTAFAFRINASTSFSK